MVQTDSKLSKHIEFIYDCTIFVTLILFIVILWHSKADCFLYWKQSTLAYLDCFHYRPQLVWPHFQSSATICCSMSKWLFILRGTNGGLWVIHTGKGLACVTPSDSFMSRLHSARVSRHKNSIYLYVIVIMLLKLMLDTSHKESESLLIVTSSRYHLLFSLVLLRFA